MNTRIEAIKQVIDISKVPEFFEKAQAAIEVKVVYDSTMPEDDKYVGIFNILVKYGLCDESEVLH